MPGSVSVYSTRRFGMSYGRFAAPSTEIASTPFDAVERIRVQPLQQRRLDDALLPGGGIARRIDRPPHAHVGDGPVVVVLRVVFARPDHLDRRADRLRRLDGVERRSPPSPRRPNPPPRYVVCTNTLLSGRPVAAIAACCVAVCDCVGTHTSHRSACTCAVQFIGSMQRVRQERRFEHALDDALAPGHAGVRRTRRCSDGVGVAVVARHRARLLPRAPRTAS